MLRSNHVSNVLVAMFILVVLVESCLGAEPTPTLQQQLIKEDISNLSRDAREKGDASRGALSFYRQDMACIRCHSVGDDNNKYGPDLTKLGKDATDTYLVESMILPSKVIKKGFETVVITTKAGKTVSGLLAEDKSDAVVIRDNAIDGKLIIISKKEITAAMKLMDIDSIPSYVL
jgi:putative heme-binding domain-containing protein